jgi:beta-lactamase superfamily II metal-dependent hydrolase
MKARIGLVLGLVMLLANFAFGQANGKLQLHFMDVGQGDAALLVSPGGETVLFDGGPEGAADRVIAYLDQLGLTNLDYQIVSHYHEDHIGCTPKVLDHFPLAKKAIDRGGQYPAGCYTNYVVCVGSKRTNAIQGTSMTLDSTSANPVRIEFVALNGNGVPKADKNENDMSLVCVVRFGQFDVVLGGDLSGANKSGYRDVESSVAAKVGLVEVYKVHHHASRYSSNTNWLAAIKPRVAVISCGTSTFHHPTKECLTRLHDAGVVSYWTELGNGQGVVPKPDLDIIGKNIIVECGGNATTFSVTYAGDHTNTYSVWNPINLQPEFAWSRLSKTYHFANRSFVSNISPQNLVRSNAPPEARKLHVGCPK